MARKHFALLCCMSRPIAWTCWACWALWACQDHRAEWREPGPQSGVAWVWRRSQGVAWREFGAGNCRNLAVMKASCDCHFPCWPWCML